MKNAEMKKLLQRSCAKLAAAVDNVAELEELFHSDNDPRTKKMHKAVEFIMLAQDIINPIAEEIDDSDIDNVVIVSGGGSASSVSDEMPETERCKLDKQQMSLPFAECESCDPSCCDTSLPLTNAPMIGFKLTKKS